MKDKLQGDKHTDFEIGLVDVPAMTQRISAPTFWTTVRVMK